MRRVEREREGVTREDTKGKGRSEWGVGREVGEGGKWVGEGKFVGVGVGVGVRVIVWGWSGSGWGQ